MIIKKIILVSISLLLYSSFAFAYDLEGKWETSGFVCRLSNGSFKEINDIKGFNYPNILMFISYEDGQYFRLTFGTDDCSTVASGTYLTNESYLILNTEKSEIVSDRVANWILGGLPCALGSAISGFISDGSALVYQEFFLRNDSLYLYRIDGFVSQQCSDDGTIFQRLVRKKTNVWDFRR